MLRPRLLYYYIIPTWLLLMIANEHSMQILISVTLIPLPEKGRTLITKGFLSAGLWIRFSFYGSGS